MCDVQVEKLEWGYFPGVTKLKHSHSLRRKKKLVLIVLRYLPVETWRVVCKYPARRWVPGSAVEGTQCACWAAPCSGDWGAGTPRHPGCQCHFRWQNPPSLWQISRVLFFWKNKAFIISFMSYITPITFPSNRFLYKELRTFNCWTHFIYLGGEGRQNPRSSAKCTLFCASFICHFESTWKLENQ